MLSQVRPRTATDRNLWAALAYAARSHDRLDLIGHSHIPLGCRCFLPMCVRLRLNLHSPRFETAQ
eukprot:4300059-Amphidinium_carterae.1